MMLKNGYEYVGMSEINLQRAFCFVTGWTSTTGCSAWSTPRRITACWPCLSSWLTPSLFVWIAVNPSRRFRKRGDRLLYALTLELTRVSPPAVVGDSSIAIKVVPGGCCSGLWSVCHWTGLRPAQDWRTRRSLGKVSVMLDDGVR